MLIIDKNETVINNIPNNQTNNYIKTENSLFVHHKTLPC